MNTYTTNIAIDDASPKPPSVLGSWTVAAPSVSRRANEISSAYSSGPLRVPLTDQQIRDYQALVIEADALLASGRYQEANVTRQVALNILRTGAPALE